MKKLIIANSSIVFGKELQERLVQNGDEVYLIDFASLEIITPNLQKDESFAKRFEAYKKIPKLSMFFRLYYLAKFIKAYDFQLVNIHYIRWYYLFIASVFQTRKLVLTYYGSDFYRTSPRVKKLQKLLLQKADVITFTNPLTKASFVEYYQEFQDKLEVCRFGLQTLDYIQKNSHMPKVQVREKLGISKEKTVVTCGYNATKAQQHAKIIEAIEALPKSLLAPCQFVFPLMYGDNQNKGFVKQKLQDVSFDYVVLEEFLYADENAYVKLASDVMINILESDSFSGSMQEFLYADNVVITGEWLPYELFDKEGIVYEKVSSPENLHTKLEYVLNNLEQLQKNVRQNKAIISKLSHWDNTIEAWKKVFVCE